ncbi:MAG: hypothetical protein AAF518_24005 [Spirochaetota bacterium]
MKVQDQKTKRMGIKRVGVYAKEMVQRFEKRSIKKTATAVKIQDHELQQVGISGKDFTKLSPELQKQIKDFLENRERKEAVTDVEIGDDELEVLKISREEFEKFTPWLQNHLTNFAKDALLQQKKAEALSEQRQLQLGFCDTLESSPIAGNIKTAHAVDKNRLFVVGSSSEKSRKYEREIKTPKGRVFTQSILIGRREGRPETYGVLTQNHQAAMYEIFRLWAQSGKRIIEVDGCPRAFITATPYQLVTSICNSDSTDNYGRVKKLIQELGDIPITIENAYTRKGIVGKLEFKIFGEVDWRTRYKEKKGEKSPTTDEDIHPSSVYIQVSAFATECFLHGHVRDFSLKTYREVGGIKRRGRHHSIASALYGFLDTELANKDVYNISLVNLFAELGLRAYRCRSQRREKVDCAIEILSDAVICGGSHRLHLYLRPSKDQRDYILVAKRIPAPMPTERRHDAVTVALSRFLNAELTTKYTCSSSLTKLFTKLGIRPYKYKSKRKQVIDHALKALNGTTTNSKNDRLQLSLSLTSNKSDYILTARRIQKPPPTEILADSTTATLYAFLNDKLATKDTCNIDLVDLFPKLGLRSYKHKNKRREKLEYALSKLDGKAVNRGNHRLQVCLRLSNDHSDYTLAAKRMMHPAGSCKNP